MSRLHTYSHLSIVKSNLHTNRSNINSRAILQSCRGKKNARSELRHVYTMSFIASPWDFAETFNRIPQLVLRVSVDPSSWEAIDLDARLSFGYKFTDIMLPSL